MNHQDTKHGKRYGSDTPGAKKYIWWMHYIGVLGEKVWSLITGMPVDDKTIDYVRGRPFAPR